MDCEKAQDAMFEVLAGGEPEIPLEDVRQHLEKCAPCVAAAPEIARDWVRINRALMPKPTEEFWARCWEKIQIRVSEK